VRRNIMQMGQVNHASWNAYWMSDIISNATQNGFGTVFTGEMGNATISFSGVPHLPPYAGRGLVQKAKLQLKQKAYRYMPYFASGHWHKGYVENSFLQKELLMEYETDIRGQEHAHYSYYTSAKSAKLALLKVGANARCTLGGLKGITYGLSYRDPSADVRVIEHCLRLPNALYFDKRGNNKQVIREAMKGILPDEVLFSHQKGMQSADLYYRLMHHGSETEELLADLRGSTRVKTWMDVPRLEKEWQLLKRQDPRALRRCTQFFKNLSFAYYLWWHDKIVNQRP
jgi:asparagine synthase (glutamine-hydrolysing)